MTSRTIRSLGVSGPGELYFLDYEEGPPATRRCNLRRCSPAFLPVPS